MAYAALVSLAQTLDQIMNHHQYCYIPVSEESHLESLQEKLSFLQVFLEDYAQIGEETVGGLEGGIRDVAYRAEDIIESHFSDQISLEDDCCGVKKGLKQLISAIQKATSSLKSRERYTELELQNFEKQDGDLHKVMERIDLIVEQVMSIQQTHKVEDLQYSYTLPAASSRQAPNDGNKMVGFDEDLLELKARLCGESSKLQIISIVGMGGIGKTTLARNIYNDSLVAYHFHTRAWITASQDYRLREVLLALLHTLTVETEDLSKKKDEELAEYVYKSLKGRTYLIVIDDMWSTEAWHDLGRFFPDDYNGSRVVITTRLTDVAVYASSCPLHQMRFLNEEWSWNLLQEKVFGQESCPPELERIGRLIAKGCGGLPLAIAVAAGILAKVDRTQYLWEKIARNISLAVTKNDKQFSKILSLSYDHLPCHLKACFLYMGGFPEDYSIPVAKLTKLWIAEGFLKLNGPKSLEELAEEYLEDLVKRNLVLISKRRSNGKMRFCGLHDLLRDLCIQKAQEEEFLHLSNTYLWAIERRRRVSSLSIDPFYIYEVKDASTSTIRSILHFRRGYFISLSSIRSYRLLRVVDVLEARLDSFPLEITLLFHLRFLAFSYWKYQKLMVPPSISKLQNLQTLIIHAFASKAVVLPFQMWKMPRLRHLIFSEHGILPIPFAARIGLRVAALQNLQTLSNVINFRFTSTAIEMIPNLKKLKVSYVGLSRRNWQKYCLKNLVQLCQLETLNFTFNPTSKWRRGHFPVISAFPPNLKKLTLSGCSIPWRHMVIIRSLPNLEVLKLRKFAFIGKEWECSEGEFPRLKFLVMEGLHLECWQVESSHFPCLERLIIKCCWQLEGIPCEIGDVQTLELIEVDGMSKRVIRSAVLIQEEQRSLGNDLLQVRICVQKFKGSDLLHCDG